MNPVRMIGLTVALPAVISGLALALAWRAWRREQGQSVSGAWGGAVGFAVAYVVGHAGLIGWPPFPAVEATQWLVWFALAAGAWGLVESLVSPPGVVRWVGRVLLALTLPALVLRPMVSYHWTGARGAVYVALVGAGILLLWAGLDQVAGDQPGPAVPLVLLVAVGGSSLALVLSASVLLGQLAGALAAAVGAALVVAWWCPRVTLARGAVGVFTLVFAGLWLNGYFYAEAPWVAALAGAAAPLAVLLARVPAIELRSPWFRALLCAAAAAVLVGIAIGFSAMEYFGNADEYTPY